MFPSFKVLRQNFEALVSSKLSSGYDVSGLLDKLHSTPDDYQKLFQLGQEIEQCSLRDSWKYVEPTDLDMIHQLSSFASSLPVPTLLTSDVFNRARAGFLSSVVGCVLGKPVEVHLDSKALIKALENSNQFPIQGYISKAIVNQGGLDFLHKDAPVSFAENIRNVPPDDDINYTLVGLMLLEERGLDFTQSDLAKIWRDSLPLGFTWGPERLFLSRYAMEMGLDDNPQIEVAGFADSFNPGSELCGALIRSHIYGYASPGDPAQAATMAWRDATMTHRGNGVYGSMYLASAISLAFVEEDPVAIFGRALEFIPQMSRLHEAVKYAIDSVTNSPTWESAYELIHAGYGDFGHCKIFQEIGTVVNSVCFASSISEGLKIQLYQGNDTDSFGAAAGAILGVHFGEGNLEDSWILPFQDKLHSAVAGFHDLSLDSVASRVGKVATLGVDVHSLNRAK